MSDEKLRLERPENDPPQPERAKPEELRDWETVQQNETDRTERLLVKGGYLYRTVSETSGHVAMVFVPHD